MKKLIRMLKSVRIKFSRSSRRTKIAVLCMVALCMVALLTLNLTINAMRNRAEEARKEAAQLEYENSQLQDKIDNPEDAARDEGFVDGDTIVGDVVKE